MDNRADVKQFLTSRRAKIRPEQVGLPPASRARRVSGLRREEVAMLAGVSVEYYNRLERGTLRGASDGVLEGVASALRLDDVERAHLMALARAQDASRVVRRRPARRAVRPAVQRLLESLSPAPAFVLDARLDVLAANELGRALYAPLYDRAGDEPPNHARFLFLEPAATDFWPDWDKAARDTVSILRVSAGRDPLDRRLSDLVGELSTRSDEFRVRWGTHDVRVHDTGTKHIHHPLVGDLILDFETLAPTADDGHMVLVYTAEPGSSSAERLGLLGSWAGTPSDTVHQEVAREH